MKKNVAYGTKKSGKKPGRPNKSGKKPGRPKKIVERVPIIPKKSGKKPGRPPKKVVEPVVVTTKEPITAKPLIIDLTSDSEEIETEFEEVDFLTTPLTKSKKKQVDYYFNHEDELKIVNTVEFPVYVKYFKRLQPTGENDSSSVSWLSDEIIDYWIFIMKEKFDKNNYLFSCSETKSNDKNFKNNFQNIPRMKRIFKKNNHIFEKNKLLIPININENHWVLILIDFLKKEIGYFDSLSETVDHTIIDTITNCLKEFSKDSELNKTQKIKEQDILDLKVNKKLKSAQQPNNKDCGVYTSANMFYLNLGITPSFEHKDIKNIRYNIAYNILKYKEKA